MPLVIYERPEHTSASGWRCWPMPWCSPQVPRPKRFWRNARVRHARGLILRRVVQDAAPSKPRHPRWQESGRREVASPALQGSRTLSPVRQPTSRTRTPEISCSIASSRSLTSRSPSRAVRASRKLNEPVGFLNRVESFGSSERAGLYADSAPSSLAQLPQLTVGSDFFLGSDQAQVAESG